MENTKVIGKNALDIFPDLLGKKPQKKDSKKVKPPEPPDISWLYQSDQDGGTDAYENAPSALVMISQDKTKVLVEKILEKLGFRVDKVLSVPDAIQKIQSFDYPLIINSIGSKRTNEIHDYICHMPSMRRRMIYYVLVGSHLHTMYNLEALTLSANMVMNDSDLNHLFVVLKKGFVDYENLFGPLIEALRMK
jgi:hypothetical protein